MLIILIIIIFILIFSNRGTIDSYEDRISDLEEEPESWSPEEDIYDEDTGDLI